MVRSDITFKISNYWIIPTCNSEAARRAVGVTLPRVRPQLHPESSESRKSKKCNREKHKKILNYKQDRLKEKLGEISILFY